RLVRGRAGGAVGVGRIGGQVGRVGAVGEGALEAARGVAVVVGERHLRPGRRVNAGRDAAARVVARVGDRAVVGVGRALVHRRVVGGAVGARPTRRASDLRLVRGRAGGAVGVGRIGGQVGRVGAVGEGALEAARGVAVVVGER